MAIISDCHLHTSFSGDSEAPMDNMIQKAISLGLKEITFTEHMDFDFIYEDGEPEGFFEVDTDSYMKTLLEYRDKYSDRIKINFGIELGMQTHINEKNKAYAKKYPFDFIIASSHLAEGMDPYLKNYWEGRSKTDAWHGYFNYIYDVVSSYDEFDTYGHLDYVLRYGPGGKDGFVFDDYREDIDRILMQIISMGKGIETNTSGYYYKMGGPHPCREILKRYRELGGEILTIGSDAHKPENMAQYFKEAEELLKNCGFKGYHIFHERKPEFIEFT